MAEAVSQSINYCPVSIKALPTVELQSVFAGYSCFNAVQSASFQAAFGTDTNLVLSAPTGSGKTAVLELAICRLIHSNLPKTCKIVYVAPTKSLCRERARDWATKFARFGITSAEVTGDTDARNMQQVKTADIIITTPEKWDSVTRRWRDASRLVRMVRLFMVDEAHMLSNSRGATLEVVLTRMKQLAGATIRLIALSATIPNLEDLARWLGKGCGEGLAIQLKFGENYRPVTLERIVYGYDQGKMNKFAFDSMLAKQAYDVYVKHGKCKPCIVFCSTRQDCQNTAKALLQAYQAKPGWSNAQLDLSFTDKGLATLVASGIAFHHAGLSLADRNMVEKLFRDNKLMILCSTSTLAVGVNLPAHLVILKNTLVYNNGSFEEYSDLDVLQMIGRAGRPQFDTTGCAIIMTDKRKQVMYEQLITGTEILESHLHLALLEHLNAEISSATIKSRTEAVDWLKKTFLYVRMKQNPAHYRLQEGQSADDILQDLCEKNITLLEEHKLVESRNGSLSPSPLGEIMANYYVRFSSFQVLVSLSDSSSQADILAALCKADEFSSLSMRSGDKGMLNLLKSLPGIRLPISSKVESLWQKIFLAAQIAPGCVDLSSVRAKFSNNVTELLAHDSTIRQHLLRLLSCLVDCKLLLKEATIINNALLLRQALASKCWNQSPAALKHIRGIGDASLRTLLHAGIRSVAQLKEAEPRELERLFKRHPPFGNKLIKDAEQLPSVSMKARLTNQTVKPDGVHLQFEVHIAAECAPFWRPETRLVNFTASTSGGLLLDFRRQRFDKLLSGKKITFDCCLTKYVTSIDFLMLCEDIICCQARQSWTLEVSASDFPEQASVAAEEDDDVWLEVIDNGPPDVVDLTMICTTTQEPSRLPHVREVGRGSIEPGNAILEDTARPAKHPIHPPSWTTVDPGTRSSPFRVCSPVAAEATVNEASLITDTAIPTEEQLNLGEPSSSSLNLGQSNHGKNPFFGNAETTFRTGSDAGATAARTSAAVAPVEDLSWLGQCFAVASEEALNRPSANAPTEPINFGTFKVSDSEQLTTPQRASKRLRFEDWTATTVSW